MAYIFHIEYNDSEAANIKIAPTIIMQLFASSASHGGDQRSYAI